MSTSSIIHSYFPHHEISYGKTLPEFWNRFLIARHGESTCNEVNRFAGSVDAPLTSLGIAQAEQAAASWEGDWPDHIFVSPLERARHTAEILFPSLEIPHQIDSRIVERDFGDFTLCNKADLQREHGIRGYDEALYDPSDQIQNSESFADFQSRIADFLFNTVVPLLKAGQQVLVVAHKYVVELMARLILNIPHGNGFDLRLPNSKVLRGDELADACGKESRILNRLREWGCLHHGWLLAGSELAGILCVASGIQVSMPPIGGILLLMVVTLLTLTRVDFKGMSPDTAPSWKALSLRFVLLPCVAVGITQVMSLPLPWVCVALLLALPSSLTSITLSRFAGGVTLPALGGVLRSSLLGCTTLALLLQFTNQAESLFFVTLLLGITLSTLLIPAWIAHWLRHHAPIATAKYGDHHAILPILLLGTFVFLTSAQLDLSSFFPYGILAIAASLLVRVIAWFVARRGTLFAADDYLALALPNLFLAIVLGQMTGLVALTQLASWFLLPLFLLAPLDVRICNRLLAGVDGQFQKFLQILPSCAVSRDAQSDQQAA